MVKHIMEWLGYVPLSDWQEVNEEAEDLHRDLYELHKASQGLRQATQELYDQYCPGMSYYPLDCALAEYDKVVMG